jgi:hypothetical protein
MSTRLGVTPNSPPVSPTRRGLSGIRRRGHSISELLGKHATPLQSQEPGAQGRNMPALPAVLRSPEARKTFAKRGRRIDALKGV